MKDEALKREQSIGINFDSRCNARCAHCCVSSSPNSTDALTDAQVDGVLDDILAHPEVREVGLTGGEPLLRRERALQIIRRVTESGRRATCVTNGFWGITPRAAESMFAALEDAGLESMTVSYDDFHAPYVSTQRIRNVLDASKNSRVHIILNMAVSRSSDSFTLLKELGESAHCIPVTRYPVLPAGEARWFPDSEFQRHKTSPADLRCPGFQIIYHNDGKVYPCCSPAIFDTTLTLGRVGRESFAELVSKVERNAILSIIQREGFGWFIEAIKRSTPEGDSGIDFSEVVSACEVCLRIFRDPAVVRQLKPQILDYMDRVMAG